MGISPADRGKAGSGCLWANRSLMVFPKPYHGPNISPITGLMRSQRGRSTAAPSARV